MRLLGIVLLGIIGWYVVSLQTTAPTAPVFVETISEPHSSESEAAIGMPTAAIERVAPPSIPTAPVTTDLYEVVRVIDGDTIEVAIAGVPTTVRYIGVDTPETVHPSEPTGCFGAEASAYNKALVAGKFVQLERDISDTDKYGRLLRYVYVDGVMVNYELVRGGYAQVVTYPPDVRYTDMFRAAEASARTAGLGLWGSVCAGAYEVRPDVIPSGGVNPVDASCVIKGNISQTSGERIYHVPGCEYYNQTVITEAAGERWFCTDAEAVASGWRKALNCP